ncbi:MAG: hypothetical protein Q4A54_08065, partial [Parabacteroides sp.]|nr:hypothetical protein [Parabacteroides sp.]
MVKNSNRLWTRAGSFYVRQKKLDAAIERVKAQLEPSEDIQKIDRLYGKLAAYSEMGNSKHSAILKKMTEIKQVVRNIDDSEYFDFEIPFFRGYMTGLEDILNIDRDFHESNSGFALMIFSESREILQKYELYFSAIDRICPLSGDNKNQYALYDDTTALKRDSESLPKDMIAITIIVYEPSHLPAVETVKKLSTANSEDIYFIKDKEDVSAHDAISR